LDKEYHSFPTPEALSSVSESDFFALNTGFRAKYLANAVSLVSNGEIDLVAPNSLDLDSAVKYLSKIKGVGLKVASCILLFGYAKTESFPIDVHIKRTLDTYFPDGIDLAPLGKEAGIVQQYLFYYEKYSQNS
jgi:N-glycosylase/DNA lyase